MTTNQILAMLNKQNARLQVLLTNALIILEENGFGGKSFAMSEVGLTEKEYKNIMGDNEDEQT